MLYLHYITAKNKEDIEPLPIGFIYRFNRFNYNHAYFNDELKKVR